MAFSFKSEEELESQRGDYTLLPEDRYITEVLGGEGDAPVVKQQADPFNKTEEFPNGKMRPVLNLRVKPISFEDGSPLVDMNGDDPGDDRKFFLFLDLSKTGLKPQPAKTRKAITSLYGKPVTAALEVDEWSDLIGKRMITAIRHKKGKHDAFDFSPIRTRPAPRGKPAAAPTSDEDLAAKAKELFGDDADL